MLDVLLVIWKIFLGVVLALVTVFIIGLIFIKFCEFVKGKEGDDYKR